MQNPPNPSGSGRLWVGSQIAWVEIAWVEMGASLSPRGESRQRNSGKDTVSGSLTSPSRLGRLAAVQYNQSFLKAGPDFEQ